MSLVFKFIQNKEDNKAKVEIIKFLYQSDKFGSVLIKNSIKKTNHSKTEIDLLGIIKQITNEFKLSKLYQLSLYDLAETLIRDFGLSNNRTNPFLLSFMELISTYSQKTNDLLQFLEYWEIKSEKASIQTPSNTDAISIMTIHKSKGLQFPVIISTFSNWKLTNGSDMAWIDTKNLIPNLPTTIIKLKKEVEHTPFKKLKIENDNSILLDNFNLLYVALTRAEKRLYIISDKNETAKKVQKASNIALYLNNICRDHVNFDSENFQLIMGEKTQHVSKIENTSEDNILNLDKIISENWRNKIEISQQYKQIWGEEKFTEKIAYGNLIHDLLAQIETEKDIEIAVINFVEKGLIETLEKDIYIQELNTILSLENVKDWFSGNGKSINEKEIISKEGFVFRPDKIVLFQDKTIVIDFKTGNKDSKHLKQINKYGDLLEEMNYPKVEKFLLYTREKEVVAV